MPRKDDSGDFAKKLMATFLVEARDHVNGLSAGLMKLEKPASEEERKELLERVFREAHSLKGAARAVNQAEIESLCHSFENVLGAWKRREIAPSLAVFDELHNAIDALDALLRTAEGEPLEVDRKQLPERSQRLQALAKGGVAETQPEPDRKLVASRPSLGTPPTDLTPDRPGQGETVRISTNKLKALLLQAEELLSAKLVLGVWSAELQGMRNELSTWKKKGANVHRELRTYQRSRTGNSHNDQGQHSNTLIRVLDFLGENADGLANLEHRLSTLASAATQEERGLGRLLDSHLEGMRNALMLPCSSMLEPFPRMVRSLARDQGKETELVVRGEEVEIDRRILEALKDPLLHLIRNAIDHGIEKPQERVARNKPRQGTITIAITSKNSSHVEICVADDGAGISPEKIRVSTIRQGVLTAAEAAAVSETEILPMIFASGVSTSPLITDVSGRGLGLAIVQEKVEMLGGTARVETRQSVGTTFRLLLPITLATFRGLLVCVGNHTFVIPTNDVLRVVRVSREEVKTVENRETIQFEKKAVSLVELRDILGLPAHGEQKQEEGKEKLSLVIVGAAQQQVALLVDDVLGQKELVVKSLPSPLLHLPHISGATILGTRNIIPILHIANLMKSVPQVSLRKAHPEATPEAEKEGRQKSLLVVEDSITARTLLKNILSAAGYVVETAVDGAEAYSRLRTGTFDLVVSDVDMPRMSGFELTAKIRQDKKLADLPVVLVTALESREDREHGIDVGANAYIVKSSFDQGNLLEVIRRLA